MKKLSLLLIAAAALFATPAWAAKSKPSKDPAHAQTWIANPKVYEGKKVTTSVIDAGQPGLISTTSKFAVIPIVTGTAGGQAGDTVNVIVATAKTEAFIKSLEPKRIKGGTFGSKAVYTVITGTFVLLNGEPALVLDEVTPEVKAIKPSVLLAKQLAAKPGDEEEKPVEKPPEPKPPEPKPADGKKSFR